jgi:hypothetical protein
MFNNYNQNMYLINDNGNYSLTVENYELKDKY